MPIVPQFREAHDPFAQRMIDALELCGKSPKTITLCRLTWLASQASSARVPEELGANEEQKYLLHLIPGRKVAWNIYAYAAGVRFSEAANLRVPLWAAS